MIKFNNLNIHFSNDYWWLFRKNKNQHTSFFINYTFINLNISNRKTYFEIDLALLGFYINICYNKK